MKIKVERYGNIGYYAQCSDCDWDAARNTEETPSNQDVRNAIRRHVRQTGHRVSVESTTATEYTK